MYWGIPVALEVTLRNLDDSGSRSQLYKKILYVPWFLAKTPSFVFPVTCYPVTE